MNLKNTSISQLVSFRDNDLYEKSSSSMLDLINSNSSTDDT